MTAAAGPTPGCRTTGAAASRSGQVPVFKFLESRDVDEVGYTLRTASLMTNPEANFDERDPSDYRLFGIRYVIGPAGEDSPVPAHLAYALRPLLAVDDRRRRLRPGRPDRRSLSANRTNVGSASKPLVDSGLAAEGAYLSVRWGSGGGGTGALPALRSRRSAGTVRAQHADLQDGEAAANLRMRRPGVAVLSSSYDPGWTATVNGRRQPTRMVAPALVAVNVPAGTDHVVFRFRGYRDYPVLLALSVVVLAVIAVAPLCVRRLKRRAP